MDILRNLVIAYLLIGLIATFVMVFIIILKCKKDAFLRHGMTIKDYINFYIYGIIKNICIIAIWPIAIIGFYCLKNEDIWTIYELCKKLEDEED